MTDLSHLESVIETAWEDRAAVSAATAASSAASWAARTTRP